MVTYSLVKMIDDVFQALAHPHRRQIIDFVNSKPGCLAGEITALFESSRIAVAKHIKVLEKADLLIIEKSGRTKLHYFNVMPIQMIYDRWTDQYSHFFAGSMHSFKQYLEQNQQEQTQQHEEEQHGKIG